MGDLVAGQNLAQFMDALRKEHEERVETLKKQVENDIADAISLRRRSVEKRIVEIRSAHDLEAERLFQRNQQNICNQLRKDFFAEYNRLASEIEMQVETELKELKRQPARYKKVMESMLNEALSVCPAPCDVIVHPGDEPFFNQKKEVRTVKVDTALESWGGCIVMSEKGDFIVDNTFKTRWEKLAPSIIRKFAIQVGQILGKAELLSRKLRLS